MVECGRRRSYNYPNFNTQKNQLKDGISISIRLAKDRFTTDCYIRKTKEFVLSYRYRFYP